MDPENRLNSSLDMKLDTQEADSLSEIDYTSPEKFCLPYLSYQIIKFMGKNLVKKYQESFHTITLLLFNIAERYRLSVVEIIIWSLYLENIPYLQMNIEYCAYASKLFSNTKVEDVNEGVPTHIKESFNTWARNSKLRFQLTFYEINKRYNYCNSIKEEKVEDEIEVNYNEYVDSIISFK